MFASWLSELISSLTPSERAHNAFAERNDYAGRDERREPTAGERRERNGDDRSDGSRSSSQ